MTRFAVVTAIAALVVMFGFSSCTRQAKQNRVLQRAEGYFSVGEFDKAKVEYLNLLRLDPRNALPYQRLGSIWFDEGAPLRAAPFLLKSRELTPDDVQSRLKLARVFLSIGNPTDSFTEAMNVLQRAPNDAEAAGIAAEAARPPEERSRGAPALSAMSNQNAAVQLPMATSAPRRGDR